MNASQRIETGKFEQKSNTGGIEEMRRGTVVDTFQAKRNGGMTLWECLIS